ncbi:oligosaccharide flippase family protein [Thalassotalea sp. G20_0]|uniref:lipopolysaccharide biosynthesis protein n=1 Tax=Thalassotalea sp. G20_0 TaxID=2821093 RepID=UPI001AD99476|nr:oligosaccharide flippase family protein [Thalassotalea sp. G20_0]MBO9496925.1 oligosaccharide flippase family protein [Thalassotalea sp. G20_0]
MFETLKNTVLKNPQINWAISDQILVSGCNFLSGIILARFLGVELYGVFTLCWLVILFFSSLQLSSIIQPMMSLAPKYEGHKSTEFYGSMFQIQIAWIMIYSLIILIALRLNIDYAFLDKVEHLFKPLFVVLISSQLQEYMRRMCFSTGKRNIAFINDSITYIGRIVIFAILYHDNNLTIDNSLYTIASTNTLSILVTLCSFRKLKFKFHYNWIIIKENFHYSKWLLASALLQWTTGNYFFIIAGIVLGPLTVGAIKSAQNIIGITHIFFQAMENFVPAQATRALLKGKKELNRYLIRLTVSGAIGTTIIVFLIAMFSEQLLTLIYGLEFAKYGYLLNYLGLLYILIYLSLPIRTGLRAIEKNKIIFIGYLVSTAFSLLAAKTIVENYNALGVILGSITTQLMMLVILAGYYFRKSKYIY